MTSVPIWLGLLGVHQDLIWFPVLMGWSFALLLWWRHPGRAAAWSWLPWAAAAGILTALLQFLVFNPPFDLFYERLVPGTNDTYTPALLDPDFFADIALAAVFAGIAAAWWWRAAGSIGARALRLPVVVLCGGLVWLDAGELLLAGTIIALLPVQALAHIWARTARHPWARLGAIFAAFLPALSTMGPLAFEAGKLQRAGPTGWFGACFGAAELLCVAVALAGLFTDLARRLDRPRRRALWRDARPFLIGGALWLVAGTLFALRSGHDDAWEVKTNRLRTAASRAAIFDTGLLSAFAGQPLDLDLSQSHRRPDGTLTVPAKNLPADAVLPLERELALIVSSTPFVTQARFVLLREGWLVAVASNRPAGPPGTVQLLRRATPKDAADWAAAHDVIEEQPVPEERQPYYCWAAVTGPDGRMLGWLDYVRAEFYSSMERKWRTGPLLVTALGSILAAAFFVQRRGSRAREEALRAAAVAAEAGRIKTAFLAKVSHELRTPLQSILGYSELLQQALPDPASRRQLAALQHHGQLMTRLVNDLIDLSALELGAFRLIGQSVPLPELVRQTVESLRPRAESKGLGLTLQISPDLPAWVETDGERLRQIILNLLGNAVKFTNQGHVRVTAAREAAAGGDHLLFAVADTGPGVAPEDHARMFAPFHRLELTAGQEGSGLGLALVAGLCRSMGGTVAVESALGAGACFRVRLPLRLAQKPPAASPAPAVELLQGKRILVADDNALVRELFTAYLQSLGAACLVACDGTEAWRRATNEPCDALVLDLAMPRMNGCDVARRLRAEGSTLRIIGVSAHTNAADRDEALAAGMDAFLTKPVELGALARALAPAPLPASAPADHEFNALRARLADRFRAELPAEIARIEAAQAAAEWDRLRDAVHHLKNSALVVGDAPLADACADLENVLTAGDYPAVSKGWTACAAALQAWLPGMDRTTA